MDLYEADYSQQEPRLYAHFANCERLLTGYNSTPVIDVHTLASQMMGIDRNHAKTLGLSIFNGMTPKTLAIQARTSMRAGRASSTTASSTTFPEIKALPRRRRLRGHARGYVRTILGRRQHFPDNLSTHVAVSRIIQGSAGDHMKVRLLDMLEWVEASRVPVDVLMTIHDAVIWQAECGAGIGEIRQILENNGPPLNLKTPMPVEIAAAATGPRRLAAAQTGAGSMSTR
jgi:DNA polymerase-1